MKTALSLSILSLSLAAAGAFAATPDGKGGGTANAVRGDQLDSTILFHGGPVMTNKNGVNVYLIWYGNWSGNTGLQIVPKFINDESGSPYFAINTGYTNA